jgi:hypothetical protein
MPIDPTKDPLFVEPPETWDSTCFLCNYAEPHECGCLKIKHQNQMVDETGYEFEGQAYGLCQECYERGSTEDEDQDHWCDRRGAIAHTRSLR